IAKKVEEGQQDLVKKARETEQENESLKKKLDESAQQLSIEKTRADENQKLAELESTRAKTLQSKLEEATARAEAALRDRADAIKPIDLRSPADGESLKQLESIRHELNLLQSIHADEIRQREELSTRVSELSAERDDLKKKLQQSGTSV